MKTIKEATELIELGIKSMGADQHLTDQIKADVLKVDLNGQCNFTKALDKMLKDKDENKQKEVRTFIRTKLQTLIKAKATQKSLLGDKVKNFSVTIRKVNKPMIENSENVFCNVVNGQPSVFNETDEKSVRVVLVSKEETEKKGFLEQLENLCEKHGKTFEDVLSVSINQLGLSNEWVKFCKSLKEDSEKIAK
tara:strand:+ start:1444 stop:2022 length:579 start_codon:yes stop_codon:yes gene_type:complete